MVPYGVDYEIPQADEDDEEDTHFTTIIEQMDEEIKVDADVSMPKILLKVLNELR
jgi:hypothetical protein